MQVARNFFLSREKVLSRKLNEIALAYKIETALTKDQILELYMNQIYLGQRSYGFSSAARSYFGKKLDQLSSPRWRCWPACRKTRRATTRWRIRSARASASTGAAPHARLNYITKPSTQRRWPSRCASTSAACRNSAPTPSTWPNWRARPCTPSSRKSLHAGIKVTRRS
jgi:hypothetical protein